jgi:hypothetical protein
VLLKIVKHLWLFATASTNLARGGNPDGANRLEIKELGASTTAM